MNDKERRYKESFRKIGKHLHKNEYLPINLASHQTTFLINHKEVLVDFGWAARDEHGVAHIPVDICGNPHPYDGFWEARCHSKTIENI